MTHFLTKKRLRYLLIFTVSILLGLFSRSGIITLPHFLNLYLGDTIWAFMVFWLFAFLFPEQSISFKFWTAILFAFAIEFSQFYHAPWIDSLRQIKIFALILGFGFKFSDLVCYTVGISFGAIFDFILLKHQR